MDSATLGKPLQIAGHILNASFFSLILPVLPFDFNSQCNQHDLMHSAGNQFAHQLSPLYLLLLKKCYRFLCDDVLTFHKLTL